MAFVTATIVDADGIPCPNADDKIKFTIEGPGIIEAVDNGNNSSHDIYKASEYSAYRGKCLAIIKAKGKTGKVTVKASATGLSEGSVAIGVK